MSAPPFEHIAIVGCGLIGGSIALAVRQRWPGARIVAVDSKAAVEAAMRARAVDGGSDSLDIAGDADLIVLAAPVRQNIEILARFEASPGSRDVLVTDVGSTKRAIAAAARGLPAPVTFVGGHPFAGDAVGGLAHARADLFRGRPWVLTPDASSAGRADGLARLEAFVIALGAAPRIMSAELHDRLAAAISHLPQLTISALMHVVGSLAGDEGLALSGAGLLDSTRLASSPSDIWRDIAATNQDMICEGLDALIQTLTQLRDSLAQENGSLDRVFASAAAWRSALLHARGPGLNDHARS